MTNAAEIVEPDIGTVPICARCGSERVVRDAWACWSPFYGLWELEHAFEAAHCHACEGPTTLIWRAIEQPPNNRVRELNDGFRQKGIGGGTVVVTRGIADQGEDFTKCALAAVQDFEAFTKDNDPYGEHDFGAVEVEGQRIFWKIDCYDLNKEGHSPNPGNPGVTHRVLTIMMANEY